MLQKHSFLSRPIFYFGATQNIELEEEEGEEGAFIKEATIFFGEDPSERQKNQVGLFLFWFEES